MKLSGKVAILNAGGAVVEVRDLGPNPVEVKADRVRPVIEEKPELGAGERHAFADYQVGKDGVTAVYTKEPIPTEAASIEERLAALEAAVAAIRTESVSQNAVG